MYLGQILKQVVKYFGAPKFVERYYRCLKCDELNTQKRFVVRGLVKAPLNFLGKSSMSLQLSIYHFSKMPEKTGLNHV